MDDVFDKIVRGEIPASKVYEDDDILAFLDISNLTKGHTLVIPKKHYTSLLETPDELVEKVFLVAKRIGNAQIKVLGASGINFLSNANLTAGQSVPHFHVHVIPRYTGGETEGGLSIKVVEQKVDFTSLGNTAQDLADALK